jgi:molecular chaperone DnaK
VAFDIDANGILHVSAKDLGTGKEQKITITANSGLSDQDIEKMVKDAEAHAEADKKEKEAVETRNRADSMIFQTEKQLKEFEGKVPDEIKKPVEDGIADLKKAKEADDIPKMREVMQRIEEHLMKLGEEIYKQSGAQAGAQGAQPGPQPDAAPGPEAGSQDEKVVDAEVIEDDN